MRPYRALGALALALVVALAACSSTGQRTAADDRLPLVYNGGELELGQDYRHGFFLHCGMEWMGEFNGQIWRTEDPIYNGIGRYPEELRQFFADPNEQISPEMWVHLTLVAEDEIRLTLPDGSQESRYQPTDEERPGCA